MNTAKLKEKAKRLLRENYSELTAGLIILLLMDGACIGLGKLICAPWLIPTLMFIVNSLFGMGYVAMILKVSRGKNVKISELFESSDYLFKYMCVSLFVGLIFFILFSLEMLAFSSLVTCIQYSSVLGVFLSIVVVTVGLLLSAAILAIGIYIMLSFSLTLFVLYDNPKMEIGMVLRKSFDMVSDYILEYVYLLFTFIGWFILGVVTAGIGFIFITPYFDVVLALFYNNIKKIYDKTTNDSNEQLISDADLENK